MSNYKKLPEIQEKIFVEQLRNGSHQAFSVLYTHYHDILVNYCKQYQHDQEEAEDIVQDIFEQLWETREKLDEDLSFSGYVHTLTRNRILQKFRQFDVHARYAQYILVHAKEATNETEESIEYNDYAALLNELIEHLSPKQIEVFKLSRIEGRTYKEIAELLHITVPTVQTHAYIAMKKIKDFLKQHADIHFSTKNDTFV